MIWRATFIDVDEEKDAYRMQRAQSLPCLPAFVEQDEDLFRDERAYVAELEAKYGAHAQEPEACGLGDPECFIDAFGAPAAAWEESEVQRRNRIVSSMLLGAKLWEPEDDVRAPRAREAIFDADTRVPSSASSGVALEEGPAPIDVKDDSKLKEFECDKLGFPIAPCASGDSCEHENQAQGKQSQALSKQHRDQLRHLGAAAKADILPLAKDRALALDATEATVLAIDRIAAALGSQRQYTAGGEGSLVAALRCLSLRSLITTSQGSLVKEELDADGTVESLLAHMRAVA